MRLVQLSLEGIPGPVPEVSLPMAAVSVLLGANDSGKSSTLTAAADFLDSVQPRLDEAAPEEAPGGEAALRLGRAVQVEIAPGSREMLFRECLADLRGVAADGPQLRRTLFGQVLDQRLTDDEPVVAQWRRVLVSAASESDIDGGKLDEALARSHVFELRPIEQDSNRLVVWEVAWCIRRDRALVTEEPLVDQQDSDYVRFAPVGTSVQTIPPAALILPAKFEAIESQMFTCALELATWLSAERPEAITGEPATETAMPTRQARDQDLMTAYALLARLATDALPRWVREHYELVAVPGQAPQNDGEGTPSCELFARRADGTIFPAAQLAAGHTLWVQLALLEGCEVLASLSQRLWLNNMGYIGMLRTMDLPEELSGGWAWQTLDEAWSAYQELVDKVRRDDFDMPVPVSTLDTLAIVHGDLTRSSSKTPPWVDHEIFVGTLRTLAGMRLRSLLYVIDEPERHLHPRLQRNAAQWLRDRMREGRTQALIATHSPAFLDQAEDVEFTALTRSTRAGYRFLPESLDACDELAAELGFDRGELLTRVETFLFVEGITDEMVLKELFAKELAESRTCVVPIHGASRHQGVIAADTLLRFTTAPAGILLDHVPQAITDQLLSEPEFRAEVRSSRTRWAELRWIADIVETSIALGRSVRPLSIPTSDVFELLDEALLRDAYPEFRGHERARVDLEVAQAQSTTRINAKAFRSDRYGIPNTIEPYHKVLPIMRDRNFKPAVLASVLRDLELARFSQC